MLNPKDTFFLRRFTYADDTELKYYICGRLAWLPISPRVLVAVISFFVSPTYMSFWHLTGVTASVAYIILPDIEVTAIGDARLSPTMSAHWGIAPSRRAAGRISIFAARWMAFALDSTSASR